MKYKQLQFEGKDLTWYLIDTELRTALNISQNALAELQKPISFLKFTEETEFSVNREVREFYGQV